MVSVNVSCWSSGQHPIYLLRTLQWGYDLGAARFKVPKPLTLNPREFGISGFKLDGLRLGSGFILTRGPPYPYGVVL